MCRCKVICNVSIQHEGLSLLAVIGANLDHSFTNALEYLFARLANVLCNIEHKVMMQLTNDVRAGSDNRKHRHTFGKSVMGLQDSTKLFRRSADPATSPIFKRSFDIVLSTAQAFERISLRDCTS
jgi:hypothetical protein